MSANHFHREGSWTTSDKAGYVLVGITQDETGKLYLMPTSQSALFRLVDHSQFLDTINNRDQKNLNKQVLALTLMGVTLAPTLFGAEMVLRGFLKD